MKTKWGNRYQSFKSGYAVDVEAEEARKRERNA